MERMDGWARVCCARRWCIATLLGACIAVACADSDAPAGVAGSGGCPGPCPSNHPAQGGLDAGEGGGNAAGRASDGGMSGSAFGDAAGMSGASAPSEASCEDDNPCTEDLRDGRECAHSAVTDGTPCNDQNLCTTEDACHTGACTGTARSNALRVQGTAYAFGGALLRGSSEISHGLVAFLSPDRLLFADALGSNTLLTLVTVDAGVLRVAAQTVTDRSLIWQPFNAWVWQTVPLAHLVALPDNRFAFFSLQGAQVFQATTDGKLLERWRTHESVEQNFDVAWTGGLLWTCPTSGKVTRYALASDSSLAAVDTPEMAGVEPCKRLAVAPDGSLYAAVTQGIVRWATEAGQPIVPQPILPGVQAIELTVDEQHIALQRAARLGAFGDTEVYRRSDLGRVALFSQTKSDVPIGLALVSGKLLLEWQHVATDVTRITGALYDLPVLGPTPISNDEWLLRSRSTGNDTWAANISRLSVEGSRVAFQPWRRVAEVDAKAATAQWLTGPGHGEIAGLQTDRSGVAQAFSPYSIALLDGSSHTTFSSGGMSLPPDVQRLEFVLPEASAPEAVASRTRAVQLANVETVTALRRGPSGLEVASAFALQGGPAQLIQRGRMLYQIAAVGDTDYRIRVYDLGSLGQSPPVPLKDFTLNVPGNVLQGERKAFEADVDAARGQLAVSELRASDARTNRFVIVWASFAEQPTVLGQGPADNISPPLLRAGQLLQVDRTRATLFTAKDGHLLPTWTHEAEGGETFFQALDVDDATRAYVTTNNGDTLIALDRADGKRLSRVSIPEVVTASAVAGDHLLIAGAHSLSTLDPACIDSASAPDAGSDGGADTDGGSDAASDPCGFVPECPDGGLVRSTLKGDATGDGCVDSSDTQLVTACLGQPVGDACKFSYVADLDRNGTVNTKDYLLALQNQGHGCDAGK